MSSLPLLLCEQLKRRCQPPYAANEAAIVEVLRALQTCDVTVELLQATRVGVLLNAVRKELSCEGAAVARQLIAQWKEAAKSAAAADTGTAMSSPATSELSATAPKPLPSPSAVADTSSHSEAAAGRSSSSPAGSASDALRASSERRKRKAADMERSHSPQPAATPLRSIADLPASLYTQHTLSPSKAATYNSDAAAHALPLYNPNHQPKQPQTAAAGDGQASVESAEQDGDAEDEMSIGLLDPTAKRKREFNSDVDISNAFLPPPTTAVAVCSLQQMCTDYLSQPAVVSQLSALPPLPQSLLLAILQRAAVQSLRRVQAGSGWIKEADLDELWKAAASKRWGKQEIQQEEDRRRKAARLAAGSSSSSRSGGGASSSWRAFYEKREADADNKLSQLGLRLKARVESEAKAKKERQGIKTMDLRQTSKQFEKQAKRQASASAAASAGHDSGGSSGGISRSNSNGHSSIPTEKRTVNRLTALRKETGGVSKQFWKSRPND